MASTAAWVALATQVVGPTPLSPAARARHHQSFLRVVQQLVPANAQVSRIETGAQRGATLFASAAQEDPPVSIVAGSFVLAIPGRGRRLGTAEEVAHIVLLAEQDTCYVRGAALTFLNEQFRPRIPAEILPPQIAALATAVRGRNLQQALEVNRSPLRLVFQGKGAAVERARVLEEALFAHRTGLPPLVSERLSMACAHFGERSSEQLRFHRALVVDHRAALQEGTPREPSVWPTAAPSCRLRSSPFLHIVEDKETKSTNSPAYTPQHCMGWLEQRLEEGTSTLPVESFEVVSRRGRWVVLEPGRTSGLKVGLRLVSEGGARLHVIRLNRESGSFDRVTAYVRSEDPQQALKVGDRVQLDPRPFRDPVDASESEE